MSINYYIIGITRVNSNIFHNLSMYYQAQYNVSAVDTLVSLSIRVVATNIATNLKYSVRLPVHLKSALLTLISRRGNVSHPVLRSLAHKNLESLDLSNCITIHDAHLDAVKGCAALESLTIPHASVSTQGLVDFFPTAPRLRVLDLSSCSSVDDGVAAVVSWHCPRLAEVSVARCANVTDVSLKHFAQNLVTLTALDISYTEISDSGIEELSKGKCRSTLTELYIDGCLNLSADSGDFLQNLTNLSNLSFCNCPELLESPFIAEFSNRKVKNLSFTI